MLTVLSAIMGVGFWLKAGEAKSRRYTVKVICIDEMARKGGLLIVVSQQIVLYAYYIFLGPRIEMQTP